MSFVSSRGYRSNRIGGSFIFVHSFLRPLPFFFFLFNALAMLLCRGWLFVFDILFFGNSEVGSLWCVYMYACRIEGTCINVLPRNLLDSSDIPAR